MDTFQLFDTLKDANYELEKKLVPILGDVMQLKLGLSDEDRALLVDNVSIIFHVAASVRFNEPLKNAVLMNTRGTREVCRLGLATKKLEVIFFNQLEFFGIFNEFFQGFSLRFHDVF